jgi:hypothetical protein
MASADGKSNPFGDGKSGATGNSDGGTTKGLVNQRGPDRPQKSGLAEDINTDNIPAGGRILKLDPPSDRQGLVGQTAASGMKHKPFKLGGKGPAMPSSNGDSGDGGPVGDVPNEDSPSDDGRD